MEDPHSTVETDPNKASVRRKRKLPNSPLSLAGSTIQEYGLFSKDVDELSAQVHRMFDFLEPWQRNADRMDKAILNGAVNGNSKTSYSDSDDVSLSSSSLPEREPTLEEELQLRLGRMTSIAKTLRYLCNKEREQRASLFAEVQECKTRCVRLVQDLALQYQQQEKVMQQRLSETERITEKLEQEKTSLQQTCHDIATQAKQTILSLEKDLTSTKDAIKKQSKKFSELSKSKATLEEECKALKTKTDELSEEITDLKHKLKAADLQKRDSDMAREHYMTLLEMSLSKLRLFEEGVITARSKDRQYRSPTPDSGNISVSPETLGAKSLELCLPMESKKSLKSMGDSMSVTSMETLSDVSVSLTDTSRVTVDEKSSSANSSYSRLVPVSPVIPPRKNKKKKNFFTNPFMKKSASLDQPEDHADRLPTIKDIPAMERYTSSTMDLSGNEVDKEHYFSSTPCLFNNNNEPLPRTSSQPSLNLELSEFQVIPPTLKRPNKKRSKSHDRLSDHENSRDRLKTKPADKERSPDLSDRVDGRAHRDKARDKSQERGRDKSRDRGRDKSRDRGREKTRDQGGKKPERQGSNKVKDKSKEFKDAKATDDKGTDQPGDAKVQRHASFAAVKPKKNGLVALAKDIEKRFKKKRRSKTADFAELFKNPEMLQKAKLEAGTLRSADTHDVDSYC